MKNLSGLDDFIAGKQHHFTGLSDSIWHFAELGYAEYRSAEAHQKLLEANGFRVQTGLAGMPTAVLGEVGEGDLCLAYLGEFDALPGLSQEAHTNCRSAGEGENGHGCGHHLLGSAALLGALACHHHLQQHGIKARIRYFGCPAEENGIGKAFLARAGYFDDVAAALTWHPGSSTGVMTGPTMANIQAYFRFCGKAAHAAGAPHLGRSALDAVELMNVGVNYLREHMLPTARVHYAITDSGGRAPNVVQARAEVLYLVRTQDSADLLPLFERVRKVAEGAALMTGTEVEVVIDKASAHMLHNQTLDAYLAGLIGRVGGPVFDEEDYAQGDYYRQALSAEDIREAQRKFAIPAEHSRSLSPLAMRFDPTHAAVGGSTDVADVSWAVPTTQFYCATHVIGTPGHSWLNVAQGKEHFAHKGMLHAARLLAYLGIGLIEQPEVLEAARSEWRESRERLAVPALLPADLQPPCQ
jgi:aminobenzoyl-glutamate utilization protein B